MIRFSVLRIAKVLHLLKLSRIACTYVDVRADYSNPGLQIYGRFNGSLYHRRGLRRLSQSASPFTPVSFVSLCAKNLKSIKDHGTNAKITGHVSTRSMKNVRPITRAVRNKTANHYETVSSTIKGGSSSQNRFGKHLQRNGVVLNERDCDTPLLPIAAVPLRRSRRRILTDSQVAKVFNRS